MGIAERVKDKYIARIEELIAIGTKMPMVQHSHSTRYSSRLARPITSESPRWPDFVEWRTSCMAVLDQVVARTSLLRKQVDGIGEASNTDSTRQYMIGFLKSVKRELEDGSLDSLALQIEAQVQSDFLDQAAAALAGTKEEPMHVAAAVIAGASLERCLRTVCEMQIPQISTTNDKGKPLGMSGMIDALKGRNVFNELRAKELRAWAALRNHAAHGQFHEFDRKQVEIMVDGISRFVTESSR